MTETINQPVSVATVYSVEQGRTTPVIVAWRNERWRVTEFGFHHPYKEGTRLFQVYEVLAHRPSHSSDAYPPNTIPRRRSHSFFCHRTLAG